MWNITVQWDLDQNIPAPVPSGFRWTASATFTINATDQPTYNQIKVIARNEHNAGQKGFKVIAISKLEPGFFVDPIPTIPDAPEE